MNQAERLRPSNMAGTKRMAPVPESIYLIAISAIDEMDNRSRVAFEKARDMLENFWGLPVVILTDVEEVVGLNIPTFVVHDASSGDVEPWLPYYVMEFSDGTRSLMMLVSLAEAIADPMFS